MALPRTTPRPSARNSFNRQRPRGAACLAVVCLLLSPILSQAQEPLAKRHPLTAYLDLRPALPGTPAQTAPSWVEAFEFVAAISPEAAAKTGAAAPPETSQGVGKGKSYFRVRLQHPAKASDHLQIRVFFDDLATGPLPRVTIWNELGEKMMPSRPLGQNLGLPSSETLNVYMNGVNYLEVEAPGDGSQVHGLFLSWLEAAQVLQPSDFPSAERERQPFGILPATRTHRADRYYHGVVTARLQGSQPLVLRPSEASAASYEFELEHPPLLAVLTYEVLGASLGAPPDLTVNGRARGESEFYLPDLADPAFRGESRETDPGMSFRYAGWIRAQKVIPGALLAAGLNTLSLALSHEMKPLAVRSVSLQLKYDWDKLDYDLVPVPPP